jgi:diguanylate cyclase
VVWFILTVGLLNVGLGFLLAIVLANPGSFHLRWPKWLRWMVRAPLSVVVRMLPRLSAAVAAGSQEATKPVLNEVPNPSDSLLSVLPRSWLEELRCEGVNVESFVEGLLHSLRLEVGKYRDQLIVAEGRLKQCRANRSTDAMSLLASDVSVINQDWIDRLRNAAKLLRDNRGQLGEFENMASGLESLLIDQASQVETVVANIASVNIADDIDGAARRLGEELGQLVDLAHILRDSTHANVAAMLRSQGRLQSLNRSQQFDEGTGLLNRTGLELLFDDWWKEDPQRLRLLSVAVIDIDRFAKLNERLGTRTGDRILDAFGKVLADQVRKDRGFDRFARLGGQSFLLFYGDIGPRNASVAADRVRQTLEAVTFDYQGNKFELSVSCGVLEVGNMEGIDDVLRRLGTATKEAKRAGRNRTALDEGEGAKAIEPPKYEVQGRVVQVEPDEEVAVTLG